MLLPRERKALEELRTWLEGRFGPRLREVVLFGSRARGEGNEDSDLDATQPFTPFAPCCSRGDWSRRAISERSTS